MRECNCSQCPGFYLGAHKCKCSCHDKKRDPLATEPLETEAEASR